MCLLLTQKCPLQTCTLRTMIREIRESVASRMFSMELSVTVGKKKNLTSVVYNRRSLYNTMYIREKVCGI